MSSILLHTSNSSPLTTTNPMKPFSSFPFYRQLCWKRRNAFATVSVTSPSISFPQAQPPFFNNADLLTTKFGNDGVSFKEIDESFVVKMVLENGSSGSIMLPRGLITSYKPKMWHGGTVEVLHTSVSERQTVVGGNGGEAVILGGVSLALDCEDDDGFSWSPTSWILADVKGSFEDCIQVTLACTDLRKTVKVDYNIVLEKDTMRSEISVSNSRSTHLRLTGSLVSHLSVTTPDATYAFGLEGSDFCNSPPLDTNFSMISPKTAQNKAKESNKSRTSLSSLKSLFASKLDEQETEEETMGEEDDNYKQLTNPMSKIYTSAPRTFTIIDRGKRNSVIVSRKGFEELYMYSPGSSYEHYGKYAYVCLGQSAILKPIIVASGQVWQGEQHLHNPNV